MTTWEYRVEAVGFPGWGEESARRLEHRLNELGKQGWQLILEDRGHHIFIRPTATPAPPSQASRLAFTINKGAPPMPNFTIDTTDGVATLQFTDKATPPDSVAGPNDSVTAAPIVPVVISDNTAALTVAEAVAGETPGSYTYALTPVAVGAANLSVSPLTNSDGSAVFEADGVTPFEVPAAVEVDVAAGEAASLTLSVTG